VRLVEEDEGVVGEVVEQGEGRLAGSAPVEVARVVLDAAAVPERAQHLDVVHRALAEALLLEELAVLPKNARRSCRSARSARRPDAGSRTA
jgi:hypothetical protein